MPLRDKGLCQDGKDVQEKEARIQREEGSVQPVPGNNGRCFMQARRDLERRLRELRDLLLRKSEELQDRRGEGAVPGEGP